MKIQDIKTIEQSFEKLNYIADAEIATVLFLMLKLPRPLLLEGPAGVGKTEVANVLAQLLETELIRLQCYEGLDLHSALYEWNYQKQLLSIKIHERTKRSESEIEKHIFGREFLLERPLLRSISMAKASAVLLIDEIDRADEEFEAFLLELLSEYQVSIPEMGTIRAAHRPHVILTSNRTRELSDALKRRCLYHWIAYPDREKELRIIRQRIPGLEQKLACQIVDFVQQVRQMNLSKPPGVAETLDWALSLMALNVAELDISAIEGTIGCILKSMEDMVMLKDAGIDNLVNSRIS